MEKRTEDKQVTTQYLQEYDQLEQEYIAQGFKSLTDYLLAQKAKSKAKVTNKTKTTEPKQTKELSTSVKVKASHIKSGSVVGFTKEGLSIVASKKTTKGCTRISYHLSDGNSTLMPLETRKTFATVKQMVDEINTIIDEEKTNEMAWW